MENEKNSGPWLSVPQFGDWDQKGGLPDYSMDFSKIREMRKQNKREISRTSIGNEDELIFKTATNQKNNNNDQHLHHHDNSPTIRYLSILSGDPPYRVREIDNEFCKICAGKKEYTQLLQLLCQSLIMVEED